MSQPGRILVVGDLVTDVVAVLAGPLATGSDTAATVRLRGGGQAANTAAWLATRRLPVTLVAAVGDDEVGTARLAELTAVGVDLAVRRCSGTPTGTVIVLAHADERSMIADRGANLSLCPTDVDTALARSPDAVHLHLSGYPLLDPRTRPAGRHALAAARAAGLTTSVDAASAAPLRAAGPAGFRALVAGADLLLANTDEATVLGVADGGPAAAGVRHLVIKRGAAGAVWYGPEAVVASRPPAAEVIDVIDPTGAGDAFAAGLLAAWVAGADPAAALAAAGRLGATAVGLIGARPLPVTTADAGDLTDPRR
ncbi:carbohydrate kinase family protein [Solwaraspora sp. WMMB335]|uniref:carbohydrate kinase family protein n=1 Tax=Solwaraspora sp. WMMB335 TaxID=3404118 RepID=UPI003B95EB69